MRRVVALSAMLAVLLAANLHAAGILPTGQSIFSCSTLFSNSINGQPIVSSAIYAYSTYTGILSTALLVILMMFVLVGLIYGLGIAFNWELLKNFAKNEYLEGFVNILIVLFVLGGIAAFNGAETAVGSLLSVSTGTATPGTFNALYTSLCNNIFQNMVIPGVVMQVFVDINKLLVSLISGLVLSFAPGGMGITIAPFAGFSTLNQMLWAEGAFATFMLAGGSMLIIMLFVIYYLFPIFLFLGVALRTFPWTRAAGGAFIALFIAFYVFFPAIMYPFTISYFSPSSPSGGIAGICSTGSSNSCSSAAALGFSSFSQYLGFLQLDIGYSIYTNLLYFSQIFVYLVFNILGLIIALLISYDLIGIFGKLLGSQSVSGSGLFSKILKGK